MTTFTSEDRMYAQMYEELKQLQLQVYDLKNQIQFWKIKAESLEAQLNQLVRSKS
jgi:hypothetical protein